MLFQIIASNFAMKSKLNIYWIYCANPITTHRERLIELLVKRNNNYYMHYSFRIITHRIKKLSLSINQIDKYHVLLFDGPLFECEKLEGNGERNNLAFKTTGFQITVLLISR